MLEKYIQARLKKKLEALGLLVLRPVIRSKAGYPDLEVFGNNGEMIFVEVKQPEKGLTKLQQQRCQELIDRGFKVIVAESYSDMMASIIYSKVNNSERHINGF